MLHTYTHTCMYTHLAQPSQPWSLGMHPGCGLQHTGTQKVGIMLAQQAMDQTHTHTYTHDIIHAAIIVERYHAHKVTTP